MKVYPSDRRVLVFRGGSHCLAPVALWELGNKALIWPLNGILGDKPPANPASGRVNEIRPPDEVEVEQINTQLPRPLLVMVPPEGAMEIQLVVVVEHLVVA